MIGIELFSTQFYFKFARALRKLGRRRPMIISCDTETLSNILSDGNEVALVDVREVMTYGAGHILWSVNVSLSRLELDLPRLVPRQTTRVVLLDSGEGLAARAASRLEELGYSCLFLLESGVQSWADAGHILHREIKVAVKGFTAFAEHHGHPSFIKPVALKAHLARAPSGSVRPCRC
jgi:rhodanese-related sulfurtransferase